MSVSTAILAKVPHLLLAGLAAMLAAFAAMVRWAMSPPAYYYEESERPPCLQLEGPRDCVIILDCSDSMNSKDYEPHRLGAAQEAAIKFCQTLAEKEPQANVAVIKFSSTAAIVCMWTPVTDLPALREAIGQIRTESSTDYFDGLYTAEQLLVWSQRSWHVVFLSDGLNNGGDPRGIADRLRKLAVINTVGVGARKSVDERLLKYIATEYPDGRKRYRWVGDTQDMIDHFEEMAGRIRKA